MTTMNFAQHFLDEAHGSGFIPDTSTTITANGEYLCVQNIHSSRYVYKVVNQTEEVHPAVEKIEHEGRLYRLEWIEDEQW